MLGDAVGGMGALLRRGDRGRRLVVVVRGVTDNSRLRPLWDLVGVPVDAALLDLLVKGKMMKGAVSLVVSTFCVWGLLGCMCS